MSAIVLPFPLARRVGSIRRMGEQISYCKTVDAANNTIAGQTRRQEEVMRRYGHPEDLIDKDIAAFHAAVWRERAVVIARCKQQQGASVTTVTRP